MKCIYWVELPGFIKGIDILVLGVTQNIFLTIVSYSENVLIKIF